MGIVQIVVADLRMFYVNAPDWLPSVDQIDACHARVRDLRIALKHRYCRAVRIGDVPDRDIFPCPIAPVPERRGSKEEFFLSQKGVGLGYFFVPFRVLHARPRYRFSSRNASHGMYCAQ